MHTQQLSSWRSRSCHRGVQAATAGSVASRPATLSIQHKQRQHNRVATLASAVAGDSDDKGYASHELADYEELLRQKKAAKQQALEAAIKKRKAKAANQQRPAAAAAADPESSSGSSGSSTDAAAPKPAAAAAGPAVPSGARFAARPRVVPAALKQQQRQQQQQQQQAEVPAAPAPAAAAAVQADAAVIADNGGDGLPSDDALQAMLDQLLEGEPSDNDDEDDIIQMRNVTTPQQQQQQRPRAASTAARRKTPVEIVAAAAARRAAQRAAQRQLLQEQDVAASSSGSSSCRTEELISVPKYNDRNLAQLAAVDPKAAALQQMLAAAAAEDDDDSENDITDVTDSESNTSDDDDDLDWEALGQYEQLEQYLGDLQKQETSPKRSAAAPAAAAAALPELLPPAAAAASTGSSSSHAKPGKKLKRVPAGTAAKQFDKDLDELEQFVALFEAMEGDKSGSSSSGGSGSSTLQRPERQQHSAAASDAGGALVAALLGKDWEAELLDDLASVIDDEHDEHNNAIDVTAANSSSVQQSLAAAEDEEPWADDVTGLLLGLVTISHERYLKCPIPVSNLAEVTEEQRCNAFWTAPWALLVTDDTAQYDMEYVNESAGEMLGGGYLDLFGQPAFEMVADSMESQSDWAYAVQRVEESAAHCARIPQLALKDMSGQQIIAKDISMWRVDSLEDTPVGMAVLVRSWERK